MKETFLLIDRFGVATLKESYDNSIGDIKYIVSVDLFHGGELNYTFSLPSEAEAFYNTISKGIYKNHPKKSLTLF